MTLPHAMPNVSVLIPVYNRAGLVGEALESALAQERVPGGHEVLVVDDGSTDDLPRVLERFRGWVRVLRRPNGGPSAARNTGVQASRGRWLAFLDSDDAWEPDKLASQLARARTSGCRLVYSDRLDVVDGRPERRLSERLDLHEGNVFDELVMGNFITLSSVLLARDAFDERGGFDEDLPGSEDWDLWLRVAAHEPIALCREPLTLYRQHPEQISRDADRMTDSHLVVLRRALERERDRGLAGRLVRRVLSSGFVDSAYYARVHRRWHAMGLLARALLYSPLHARAYRELLSFLAGAVRTTHPAPEDGLAANGAEHASELRPHFGRPTRSIGAARRVAGLNAAASARR